MNSRDLERVAAVRALALNGEARTRREAAQLSLSEVASNCGVDTSTVWRWETGQRRPRGEAALRYWRLLDLLDRGPSRATA